MPGISYAHSLPQRLLSTSRPCILENRGFLVLSLQCYLVPLLALLQTQPHTLGSTESQTCLKRGSLSTHDCSSSLVCPGSWTLKPALWSRQQNLERQALLLVLPFTEEMGDWGGAVGVGGWGAVQPLAWAPLPSEWWTHTERTPGQPLLDSSTDRRGASVLLPCRWPVRTDLRDSWTPALSDESEYLVSPQHLVSSLWVPSGLVPQVDSCSLKYYRLSPPIYLGISRKTITTAKKNPWQQWHLFLVEVDSMGRLILEQLLSQPRGGSSPKSQSIPSRTLVVQSLSPFLCDPMDCSTPDLPGPHRLLEPAQTHVHWVSDAIQPSHPLSSPSPHAFNLYQHQGLF